MFSKTETNNLEEQTRWVVAQHRDSFPVYSRAFLGAAAARWAKLVLRFISHHVGIVRHAVLRQRKKHVFHKRLLFVLFFFQTLLGRKKNVRFN